MKTGAFLMGCFLSFLSLAQRPGMNPGRGGGQQMAGRFYGKIVDANNKGIDAASVVLLQERMDTATKQRKETVVGGMLTSANGQFSIENVPAFGRFKLRVTGIGYNTYEQTVGFERPANTNGDPSAMLGALDKDLGNIKLAVDDKVLSGVTITATSKPLLQMGIDRKIFNVDRNIVSAGGTAIDVMKNVPSVNVDIDGNVTLRNNAPQVFVDGRPTNLTLEQIPADAIESVEIITNPSAKFDASGGTAGILNIVLKKNKRVGYAGNIRTSVDSRARFGGGADINVRQNKINVFVSGNVFQRKSLSWGSTKRLNKGNPNVETLQEDDNTFIGLIGFGRAGIDYFIDNRNTLTITGMLGRGSMRPENSSDIFVDSLYSPVITSYSRRLANSENEFRNRGTQLSFKHLFPQAGREWTADVTYNKGRNKNENLIRTNYFKMPEQEFLRTYRQQQLGSGENDNLIVQTDYTNPINDKSKFELGGRISIRNVNSANNFYALNRDDRWVPLPGQDILYNSKDKVYAAYTTYSNRIKNFGYQLGLRVESSDYKGVLPNKNQSFNIEFPVSLFPSVFLSQRLNETDDLQLNYSRRINRPNFWQLYPFTDYSDSLFISRGNPNLKPEFTNSVELSYSKVFKNRDNFMASVYFKNTNDLITRFQTLEQDTFLKRNIIVSTYVNANKSYITGLELTGRNKLTKFWDVTSNANFFTAKIDLENEEDPDQFLSYFIKINNNFRLPKNFSIQLSGDYQSRIISSPSSGGGGFGGGGGGRGGGFGGGGGMFGGNNSAAQGFIRPNFGVDAAVRFEFLKNRAASLSLNVNDIFRTRKYNAHTESQFFVQDIERRRDPQVARLNFSWRFGKMDVSLFKRRNNRSDGEGMDNMNF